MLDPIGRFSFMADRPDGYLGTVSPTASGPPPDGVLPNSKVVVRRLYKRLQGRL